MTKRKRENPIPKTTKGKGANYRPTKSGAGMTKKGVAAYRKANPGSKLSTAVTGKVKIKIDAGTQSGKILRLKGKGLPSIERYGNGDFLIHINVWTPQELNKNQRKFFEQMQEDENFSPNPQHSDKSFFEKVKDMFS